MAEDLSLKFLLERISLSKITKHSQVGLPDHEDLYLALEMAHLEDRIAVYKLLPVRVLYIESRHLLQCTRSILCGRLQED
jgi:hypothetical protein